MLLNPFDESPLHSTAVLSVLAALWLSLVVLGIWASHAQRRWPARIGIAASLVIFVVLWLSVSPLTSLLLEGIYVLLYPANRHVVGENPYALLAILLAASNIVGIAGIWASLARRPHWFFRLLPMTAIATLLLLARVYEPCFVFLVQTVVTVVPLVIARNLQGWDPFGRPDTSSGRQVGGVTFRLGVLDVLAIAVVIATVLGVVFSAPEKIVVHEATRHQFTMIVPSAPSRAMMASLGAVMGLVMLLAVWVTLSRSAAWLRMMGLLLAWPGLLCTLWLGLWREAAGRPVRVLPTSAPTGLDCDYDSPRRRALGRVGLLLLSLLILGPLALIYDHLAFAPPVPEVALPTPNGYDDLLAASKRLAKALGDQEMRLPALWQEASEAEETAFRVSNRGIWNITLQEVHAALDRPSRVPLCYHAIEYGRYEAMDDLASALRIEGKAAASERRFDDAIRCFKDIVRLGQAAGRGGLLIDRLANGLIQGIGIEQFHELAGSLDAAQCRMAIETLAAEDKEWESFEDVWQRELVWCARALGWSGRLYVLIGGGRQRMRELCETGTKHTQAELRIAMTELAVRAYFREHGALPKRLSQLVPDYLVAVPVDPLTDQPPAYKLNGHGYLLYSPAIPVGWAAPPPSDR